MTKEESTTSLARALREQNPETFSKLDRLTALARAVKVVMPKGEQPYECIRCLICNVEKHRRKWLLREGACTGGTCYSCYSACRVLGVSRSPDVIVESGALEIVRSMSRCVRKGLAADNCHCGVCISDK